MKLVIVGSIALDSVKTPFGERKEVLGGSTSYASVAASYLTDGVGIVGVVGEDFPAEHIDLLQKHGVDLSSLEKASGRSFRWKGHYDKDLSQAITEDTQLNVFETFVPKLSPEAALAPYLFLANIHPALQLDVAAHMAPGCFISGDTMNLWIDKTRDELLSLIKKVPLFTLNETEARLLTGKYHLIEAANEVLKMGVKTLIIKRGEYGALLFAEDRWFNMPAMLLNTIKDPTGAGDTFAGGFMGYLAATGDKSFENLCEATIFGTVMASFTVEGFSLERLGSLTRDDIVKRYRELKKAITVSTKERFPW